MTDGWHYVEVKMPELAVQIDASRIPPTDPDYGRAILSVAPVLTGIKDLDYLNAPWLAGGPVHVIDGRWYPRLAEYWGMDGSDNA